MLVLTTRRLVFVSAGPDRRVLILAIPLVAITAQSAINLNIEQVEDETVSFWVKAAKMGWVEGALDGYPPLGNECSSDAKDQENPLPGLRVTAFSATHSDSVSAAFLFVLKSVLSSAVDYVDQHDYPVSLNEATCLRDTALRLLSQQVMHHLFSIRTVFISILDCGLSLCVSSGGFRSATSTPQC